MLYFGVVFVATWSIAQPYTTAWSACSTKPPTTAQATSVFAISMTITMTITMPIALIVAVTVTVRMLDRCRFDFRDISYHIISYHIYMFFRGFVDCWIVGLLDYFVTHREEERGRARKRGSFDVQFEQTDGVT